MKTFSRAGLAAVCATALLAPAAYAGPTVTLRVEAVSQGTLVPATQLTLGDGMFQKVQGHDCAQSSRAGALEAATGGDWSGDWHPQFGQQIDRIRSVSLPLSPGDRYWGIYLNRRYASNGNCDPLQQGDEVVLTVQCASAGATDCWRGGPLDLQAPATVRPGTPFSVTVNTVRDNPDWSQSDAPFQGATVSGGGASATTGADGRASLTLAQRGVVSLTASATDNARESVQVCVTDGADGYCGTRTPAGETVQPAPTTAGSAQPFVRDLTAPTSRLLGVSTGRTYSRAGAPRVLRGKVDEAGGVLMVKLRLTRTYKGRCYAYSGRRERFIRRPECGGAASGWWFSIGDRADWEFQLASRLGPGRYVLDVNAIDKAYNRDDARRRGENRVVFNVR